MKFQSGSIHETLVEEVYTDNRILHFCMAIVAGAGLCVSMAISEIGSEAENALRWRNAKDEEFYRRKKLLKVHDSLNHKIVLN